MHTGTSASVNVKGTVIKDESNRIQVWLRSSLMNRSGCSREKWRRLCYGTATLTPVHLEAIHVTSSKHELFTPTFHLPLHHRVSPAGNYHHHHMRPNALVRGPAE